MTDSAGNLWVQDVEGNGRFRIYDIQWEHHAWQFDLGRGWMQYWRQGGGDNWTCNDSEIRRGDSSWEVYETAEECRDALIAHEDHLRRMRILPKDGLPAEMQRDLVAEEAMVERLIAEYRLRPLGGWVPLVADMNTLVEAQWSHLSSCATPARR